MSSKVDKETFCSRPRYLSEIADYLVISPQTLRSWLDVEPIEGIRARKIKRLFSQKEVRIIIEYFA